MNSQLGWNVHPGQVVENPSTGDLRHYIGSTGHADLRTVLGEADMPVGKLVAPLEQVNNVLGQLA